MNTKHTGQFCHGRKMRIDAHQQQRHTARMDERIDDALMDEAEQLALAAFGPYAELEHIVAVYQAIVWMHSVWLPTHGVATLH